MTVLSAPALTTPDILHDADALSVALDSLGRAVPRFAEIRTVIGDPHLRRWPTGFATLVEVIAGQQVSTASADAIFGRLKAAIVPMTPATMLAASDETLRACGLSRQKMAYVRDLAVRQDDGRLDLDALEAADDEAFITGLTEVKGIGRWTAEIYLLFALGRGDVWPSADLALAVGAHRLFDLADRPTPAHLRALAEDWRPWRGAAAHMLWHTYHHFSRPRSPAEDIRS